VAHCDKARDAVVLVTHAEGDPLPDDLDREALQTHQYFFARKSHLSIVPQRPNSIDRGRPNAPGGPSKPVRRWPDSTPIVDAPACQNENFGTPEVVSARRRITSSEAFQASASDQLGLKTT
jgi:hypothetical protein